MSRQNLRSSKTGERSKSGESSQEEMDQSELARHFNEEVKYAIIGRGISRVEELIDLLEKSF